MKTLKSLSLLTMALAFSALLFSSCSKDDAPANQFTTTTDGNWRLSLYYDNGSDDTGDYSGYTFTFNTSGQVSAGNGSNTVTGTWSQTSTKFILDFGADPLFSKLNDDWLMVEKTSTSIKVKDDNPAKDEKLQFTRL